MEMKAMTLRLPADQAVALEAVARADEMPVSEAVRTAIEAHIEARRQDPAFRERLARIMEENQQVLKRLARGPTDQAAPAQLAVNRAMAASREGDRLLFSDAPVPAPSEPAVSQ
jgi:hypothetical protein